MPFVSGVVGIVPAPQVASLFNRAIWDRHTRRWSGLKVRQTMERDQVHQACVLAGGKSLHYSGCGLTPPLVRARDRVILCILYCTMAMGRLHQDFIKKEGEGPFAADMVRLDGDLADHTT